MANIFSKHRNKLRAQSKKQKKKQEDSRPSASDKVEAFDGGDYQEIDQKQDGSQVKCQILSLSHEGRGIAKNKGKTQFVYNALPNETVLAQVLAHRSKYDELQTVKIIEASEQRVEPRCQHYGVCGGCSLQHMKHSAQLEHKKHVLLDQLNRFGDISPAEYLEPIQGKEWHYRSRTRLSVDYGRKGEALRLGYRKKNSNQILDIESCPVLNDSLANIFPLLKEMLLSLSGHKAIGHIELSSSNEGVVLLLRVIKPLSDDDQAHLNTFCERSNWILYLQEEDVASVKKVWPEDGKSLLSYSFSSNQTAYEGPELSLAFHPKDFTQINLEVNHKMVELALQALDLSPSDKALDLFSGLGNFALPMANYAAHVIGVEGSQEMVERGNYNAKQNQLDNVSFYKSNLYSDFSNEAWAQDTYDKILLDPPRAGAMEIVSNISRFEAKRIVYISCNPATLARDSGVLVKQGYHLSRAGILDMFPHTEHLESIAIFDRD